MQRAQSQCVKLKRFLQPRQFGPLTGMDGVERRGFRPRSHSRGARVPETRRIRDVPVEERFSTESGRASINPTTEALEEGPRHDLKKVKEFLMKWAVHQVSRR
jgi:hypothetical protein